MWNVAFPLFCAAALTDMVDGSIARILGQRTRLGAFLDPAGDKLLMFFSFLTLALGGFIPVPFFLLVFARDLLIVIGIIVFKVKNIYVVYRPTYLSNLTTFLQILTVLSAMISTQQFHPPWSLPYDRIWTYILGMTTLLTVVTGIQYIKIGLGLLHAKTETHRQ